jgi:rod shape determining protein RodA
VPEQHTDFIFTSVGENFGFWGSALVVLLYLLFLLRIVYVAERQRSTFSRVYAYSVAGIIFFHVAINICMTIGLAPVIGITLPLLSYGGSSLLTFTILIFILVKLDADRQMVLR